MKWRESICSGRNFRFGGRRGRESPITCALVRTNIFLVNPPSKTEQLSVSKLWCTSQLHLFFPLRLMASSLTLDIIPVKMLTSLTLLATQRVYYWLLISRSVVVLTTSKNARTSVGGRHPFCFWLRRPCDSTDEACYLINDQNSIFLLCVCREPCIIDWVRKRWYLFLDIWYTKSHWAASSFPLELLLRFLLMLVFGSLSECVIPFSLFSLLTSCVYLHLGCWGNVMLSWRWWPQQFCVPQTHVVPGSLPHTFEPNSN